jgi:hypothetical protein
MSEQSVDDLLTETEAAEYLRIPLADFRALVLPGSPFGSRFAAYDQLPPGRRPEVRDGSRPGYVPMYDKAELEAYRQKHEPRAAKEGGEE